LHLVLIAADFLVAWPLAAQLSTLAAIACHCAVRRPQPTPRLIIVGADATFVVPEWSLDRAPLGPRTVVCVFWIRLDLGMGPARRDLLLFADQLDAEHWARLRGLLGRARCDTAHVSQRPREPI
jgi:hypothetical protein